MIYCGPDTDIPAKKFRIDRAYSAAEILAEDPDAFFHVWNVGRETNNLLFAVVWRPDNQHFKAAGFSFHQLDNGLLVCTGVGIPDYYEWNEERDVRLRDCLDVLHGSDRRSGSVLELLLKLDRLDLAYVSGIPDLELSECGDWVRYEDLEEIIDQLRNGELNL